MVELKKLKGSFTGNAFKVQVLVILAGPEVVGVVVLEGDYTNWAVYDSFDDANISNSAWYQYAVVNRAETVVLLIDREGLGARKYVISTKTLGALVDEYVFPGVFAGSDVDLGTTLSLQGTYVCALVRVAGITKGNGVAVWKNGDLIKTFTAADLGLDANEVYSVSISWTGKYLVVSGTRTATANYGWVVLVGS